MIFVVDRRVVLSAVVAVVVLSTVPVDAELLLRFAASEPVEAHVHGFQSLRHDFIGK